MITEIKVRAGDRVLIPGDIHFPVQDQRCLDVMTNLAADLGVTKLFLQGDTFDYWGLSRHQKSADRAALDGHLKDELAAAAPWLTTWTELWPTWMGPGNHEDRWYDLVDDSPALLGTEWFSPLEWHDLDHGVTFLGRNYLAKLGPLVVCHGDTLRGAMRNNSARSVLSEYPGQNTVYGHTHRIDVCTRPTWKNGEPVSHGAWNVGHLSDVSKQQYASMPVWEHGFGIVDFYSSEAGGLGFTLNQARIHTDGRRRVCNVLGKTKRA